MPDQQDRFALLLKVLAKEMKRGSVFCLQVEKTLTCEKIPTPTSVLNFRAHFGMCVFGLLRK
jgi:hypothetical protein